MAQKKGSYNSLLRNGPLYRMTLSCFRCDSYSKLHHQNQIDRWNLRLVFLCFNSLFCCPLLQPESKYFCSWFTKYKFSVARARHKRTNNLSQFPFSVPMPQRQPWQLLLIVLQLIAAPVNKDLIGKVQRCAQKTIKIFRDGISSHCFWVHFLRLNQRQSTVIVNQLSFSLFFNFCKFSNVIKYQRLSNLRITEVGGGGTQPNETKQKWLQF